MSYKSVKDVVTMLQENGFVLKSQKGSQRRQSGYCTES